MFQDITTLLLDPKAFKDTIDLFVERYKGKNISVVAGIYIYTYNENNLLIDMYMCMFALKVFEYVFQRGLDEAFCLSN